MASIAENLRATLLSLKQISDRVKSLILTVVTKIELSIAKQEIIDAIDDIDIDTSDLAKQGTNPNTSLTVVDDKIDNFYDTFDADIASQLYECIGEEEAEEQEEEHEEVSPSQSET